MMPCWNMSTRGWCAFSPASAVRKLSSRCRGAVLDSVRYLRDPWSLGYRRLSQGFWMPWDQTCWLDRNDIGMIVRFCADSIRRRCTSKSSAANWLRTNMIINIHYFPLFSIVHGQCLNSCPPCLRLAADELPESRESAEVGNHRQPVWYWLVHHQRRPGRTHTHTSSHIKIREASRAALWPHNNAYTMPTLGLT